MVAWAGEIRLVPFLELMMRELSSKYKRIAERLIASEDIFTDIRELGIRIAYLSSDEEKKKDRRLVHADCTKVDKKYSWAVPYDFFITVYEPNCIGFTRKQFEILMKHELMHIGVSYEGDEPSFYLVPHDVEDFLHIINTHGLDWSRREE